MLPTEIMIPAKGKLNFPQRTLPNMLRAPQDPGEPSTCLLVRALQPQPSYTVPESLCVPAAPCTISGRQASRRECKQLQSGSAGAALPRHYLLRTGWRWGARWQGTLVTTCLVHQGILNIGIFMSFPFAFLKVRGKNISKADYRFDF